MALVGEATLKSVRGSLTRSLRYLKRVKDEVTQILSDREGQGDETPATDWVESLQEKTEVLQQQLKEFNDFLDRIEQIAFNTDDNTCEAEIEQWADTAFECKGLVVKAQRMAGKSAASRPVPPSGQVENGVVVGDTASVVSGVSGQDPNLNENFTRLLNLLESQQNNGSSGRSGPAQAKLPKLELPKFSGDILKWKPFWDRFEASVDKNEKLASVDKLSYLISQLKDDPLKMVESLPVTNENYPVACQMLKQKYGDSRMVIALLYRKLNEMKPVKNEVASLRQFVGDIECLLGSLGALGQNTSDDNFATIILSKLPGPTVVQLELSKDVKITWTVALVREKLTEYLTRIEMASKIAATNMNNGPRAGFTGDSLLGSGEKQKRGKKQGKDRNEKADKNERERRQRSPSCVYCGDDHWSDQCQKYQTADDRFKQLKDRCNNCLSSGHRRRECKSKKPCFYCKKVGSHHSSLCFDQFGRNKLDQGQLGAEKSGKKESSDTESDDENGKEIGPTATGLLASSEEVSLQTAQVPVSAESRKDFLVTRVLMDPGCNRSYCSQSLKKRLGLKTKPGPSLTINRFGSNTPLQLPTETAKIQLKSLDGKLNTIEISVIPHISGSLTRVPVKSKRLKKFQCRLTLADTIPIRHESGPIHLLLGSDYYLEFITGEKIEVEKGLYLLGSEFGYILSGRMKAHNSDPYTMSMCGITSVSLDSFADIEPSPKSDPVAFKKPEMSDYWSLEGIGIHDDPTESDDQKAIVDFEKNVKLHEGRYSVSLPWNDKASDLQSDYGLCLGRLKSLVKRIGNDDHLWSAYGQVMNDQYKKGVIEKVSLERNKAHGSNVHYIPHHAVVNPQSETTKLRIVYDGSAKCNSQHSSLNESLYRGPVLLKDLVGVLLRFRLKPIAIISDIEKAFLQIEIDSKDRDLVRFLWLKDPDRKEVDGNIQVYRFARVPFGLNCSPSLLAQVVRHHLQQLNTVTSNAVLENLYVDNVFACVETAEDAKKFYVEAKDAFRSASMNLRSWSSNSKELVDYIPSGDKVKSTEVKVLGMQWDTVQDTISVNGPGREKLKAADSKRSFLSCISSVFDPLGWFAPCTVPSKCILQCLCTGKDGDWDAKVPETAKNEWRTQSESLVGIQTLKLPRMIPSNGELTLATFCDASTTSYAAVVYLICDSGLRKVSSLLMAKSRLNPMKKLSIPRLELMGVLIGTRLLKFVSEQLRLNIRTTVLFSDSTCVLSWLKSQKQLDVFVRNRLKEITTKIPNLSFRYVQTDQNPADWATRKKNPEELNSFWWNGPPWLTKGRSEWPDWGFEEFTPKAYEQQDKGNREISLVSKTETIQPLGLNPQDFSSLTRFLRITAWCMRFITLARKQIPEGPNLTAIDLQKARDRWDKYVQRKHFGTIIEAIESGKKHNMMQLGLFVDEKGLLRCKGRMSNSALNWVSKFPKLLPAKDPYTSLIVQSLHRSLGHNSVGQTLNSVRKEYWIPRGRALVSKIVFGCTICRKAVGRPYATPTMPELPSSRVQPQPCFQACGVDYFGPLKLKGSDGSKKAWVCLFTCLSTRAVHLELVNDLTSTEFVMALRRFIARRGTPKTMVSDNGPQFKVASQVLEHEWSAVLQHEDVIDFCSNGGIKWSFITEFAPFMGGVYERLVGIVKQTLRKTVGSALLTDEQFRTLLCDCEAAVNCRPLTYVDSDVSTAVLTPAHFLNPNQATVSPEVQLKDDDYSFEGFTKQELIKNWRKGQNLLDEFWRVWLSDYLNMLRERSIYQHRHNSQLSLKPLIGHLVLIKEANLPRGSWRIGRIVELHESSDSEIRSATVQVPSGRKLKRPVGLLVPFETEVAASKFNECNDSDKGILSPPGVQGSDSVGENLNTTRVEEKQHTVALAKLRGYPNWPAKILSSWSHTPLSSLKQPKNTVAVQFFKTDRFAYVPTKDVSEFDPKRHDECKRADLKEAYRLAREWIENDANHASTED